MLKDIAEIIAFIQNNSVPLFESDNSGTVAFFDDKGFNFSELASVKYKELCDFPHLYIAFTRNKKGFYYVGKSYQRGGRWKKQHAYHLGTLAYHLLNNIRGDDQNHFHWIESWMDPESKKTTRLPYSITLKERVYITFIPFLIYSEANTNILSKPEIRDINSQAEKTVINYYKIKGFTLLNVHHNR